MTYYVDILNPKAAKLLQDLADMELIALKPSENNGFSKVVKKLRSKAAKTPLSLDDITKEVESVRSRRYAVKK